MLTEGFLAILVILACAAGIGLGTNAGGGATLSGTAAWQHHYAQWGGDRGLADVLAPFIRGSSNMITVLGLTPQLATAIMGVFVASFAATTLDSATRLQRYIISELISGSRPEAALGTLRRALAGRLGATCLAVVSAGALAFSDALTRDSTTGQLQGLANAGKGGLVLWPVFGATNQLLGGLALLVITVWLAMQRRSTLATAVPMIFMLAMTAWAIVELFIGFARPGENLRPQWHLALIAAMMLLLQVWITIEGVRLLIRRRAIDQPSGSAV
jgi:carbon starvation protein